MKVEIVSYPAQEWILDEETEMLGEPSLEVKAIAQDVKFAMLTERNKYPIMGSNFGVEFLDLVGKDPMYIKAQIKARIKDALSIDDRITAVTDFKFKNIDANSVSVSFVVETVLGKVGMTTEIIA